MLFIPQPSTDFSYTTTAYPGEIPSGPEDIPYYFILPDAGALLHLLHKPGRFFLEAGARAELEAALEFMHRLQPDFALNLTTKTAYDSILSETIALAIEQRFFLSKAQRMSIMTCLQEAIANAVLHGNLELGSLHDPGQFQHYYDAAAGRISEEPYRSRRIGITAYYDGSTLQLDISDQGNGFPSKGLPEQPPGLRNVSGHGLFMIRTLASHLWLGDDNRTLCMTFKQ